MRVLLGQLAPRKGDVTVNLDRALGLLAPGTADLAVFPELFLSGYRVGDRIHSMAIRPGDSTAGALHKAAKRLGGAVAVGGPLVGERPGEVANAVLVARPDAPLACQVKRYLPTYGPFEEGSFFTPTSESAPIPIGGRSVGFQICYDAFFPEVSRELALGGAELLVVISASPVTSRKLFEKVLPARAVENAVPLVYVNRVGAEDGVVFGGGSAAWDARGEPLSPEPVPFEPVAPEETVGRVEIDLDDAPRWRPFRPVLRDVASRPPAVRAGGTSPATVRPSRRTDGL